MSGRKYTAFLGPIEEQENGNTIKWKLRFINSVRFTPSSLSSLAKDFADGLNKDKCKDFSHALATCQPKMVDYY